MFARRRAKPLPNKKLAVRKYSPCNEIAPRLVATAVFAKEKIQLARRPTDERSRQAVRKSRRLGLCYPAAG